MPCVSASREKAVNPVPRGVILVTVLWVLVLLSLIATNLSLASRSFSRQTLNVEQGTRAGLAADAGISWAMWNLQQPPADGWLADGAVHWLWLDQTRVGVRLQDESGKLDLNAAPAELLDALLLPVIEDSLQRAQLVAAIEDWRDSDDLVRLNGAEVAEYQAVGREAGPANRPFASLQELNLVLGMSNEIYTYLLPHLTLMTRVRTVNPRVASFEVLMALPNASEQVVRDFIEQRREAWEQGLPFPELPFDAAPYTDERRSGLHFRVDVEARLGEEVRLRRAARLMRQGARIRLTPERPLPGDIPWAGPEEEGTS
ncbi:general secretion pathway protein GspK [Marinobacterium sediminicola]|uniref:General secretion pathway protein K n=1 Tax=Marinobacterium sediminicola TaxID=518898 RepID=A0ABY1S4F7_9GAMM|nr:type II secretion system protein GspK [Marinobacterium sediminicola]ULG68425.1 general secretion pathway protein GspK [Marinobacterium sediminicola]SMR78509.1 general secretion pathway protein K [Marinobacterium sediminicola]